MKLTVPIKLAPNEKKGLYAHSACPGDEQIVYDNQRHQTSLSNTHLDILPGLAHFSDIPFSPESQFLVWWGPPLRERRGFVRRWGYGVYWLHRNPDVHEPMPPLFRQMNGASSCPDTSVRRRACRTISQTITFSQCHRMVGMFPSAGQSSQYISSSEDHLHAKGHFSSVHWSQSRSQVQICF